VGFEPTYPGREFPFKGTGFDTSLRRLNKKQDTTTACISGDFCFTMGSATNQPIACKPAGTISGITQVAKTNQLGNVLPKKSGSILAEGSLEC
jgi:hypothetical protein